MSRCLIFCLSDDHTDRFQGLQIILFKVAFYRRRNGVPKGLRVLIWPERFQTSSGDLPSYKPNSWTSKLRSDPRVEARRVPTCKAYRASGTHPSYMLVPPRQLAAAETTLLQKDSPFP